MKIISSTNSPDFIPSNDLQLELSLISSGLIVTEVENSVIFIIKDSNAMVRGISNIRSLLLNFTSIPRPEFPTVNAELKLKSEKGLSVKYDYFFNSESEYELNLLNTILNQNVRDLYFLTDIPEKCVRIEMESSEVSQLAECLEEI